MIINNITQPEWEYLCRNLNDIAIKRLVMWCAHGVVKATKKSFGIVLFRQDWESKIKLLHNDGREEWI